MDLNSFRIRGIGIDVAAIKPTQTSISTYGSSWLKRQFTNHEISRGSGLADPASYFTTLFAVKEAVAKAFGHGIDDELPLLSMDVNCVGRSVESIVFSPSASSLAKQLEIARVRAVVTLLRDHVVATALAEG